MAHAQVVAHSHLQHMLVGTSWPVILMWVALVAIFLVLVPRVFRMRRRAKSGLRTE